MVATLKDSVSKMNDLLARLSQHHRARAADPGPVELLPLAERVAYAKRAQHPVVAAGAGGLFALADAGRLEQVLGHLVQNAIEASAAFEPVTVLVGEAGQRATVAVVDRGCGMSPAFLRDQLFKPFVSSKPGGFGLGAFEARQLAEAMGGVLDVESREGEGTTFRLSLPVAQAWERAA